MSARTKTRARESARVLVQQWHEWIERNAPEEEGPAPYLLVVTIEALLKEEAVRSDGEPWESYARRLEVRIKEQRDQLESLNQLREGEENRAERNRINRMRLALGEMTERWYRERTCRIALVRAVKEAEDAASLGGVHQ